MRRVQIVRFETDKNGTFGELATDSGFQCYTMELPDKENKENISCIPAGEYIVKFGKSDKFVEAYKILSVPNRTDILIHSANWGGDSELGLKCQLNGCIALGRAIGEIAGQKALLSSRDAINGFINDLEKEDFKISIEWSKDAKARA